MTTRSHSSHGADSPPRRLVTSLASRAAAMAPPISAVPSGSKTSRTKRMRGRRAVQAGGRHEDGRARQQDEDPGRLPDPRPAVAIGGERFSEGQHRPRWYRMRAADAARADGYNPARYADSRVARGAGADRPRRGSPGRRPQGADGRRGGRSRSGQGRARPRRRRRARPEAAPQGAGRRRRGDPRDEAGRGRSSAPARRLPSWCRRSPRS